MARNDVEVAVRTLPRSSWLRQAKNIALAPGTGTPGPQSAVDRSPVTLTSPCSGWASGGAGRGVRVGVFCCFYCDFFL